MLHIPMYKATNFICPSHTMIISWGWKIPPQTALQGRLALECYTLRGTNFGLKCIYKRCINSWNQFTSEINQIEKQKHVNKLKCPDIDLVKFSRESLKKMLTSHILSKYDDWTLLFYELFLKTAWDLPIKFSDVPVHIATPFSYRLLNPCIYHLFSFCISSLLFFSIFVHAETHYTLWYIYHSRLGLQNRYTLH